MNTKTEHPPINLNFIKTERLLIRPVRLGDAAIMHAAMKSSFIHLKRWMPWAQGLASIRDTEVYLVEGEKLWRSPPVDDVELPLQIMDLSNKIYYGATGIKPANLNIPSFEIGYWVNHAYTGKGYITEAMNALTRYLFEELRAKRVEINCEEGNKKSLGVAERLNYQLEGVLRNSRLDASGRMLSHSMVYSCIQVNDLPPLECSWG